MPRSKRQFRKKSFRSGEASQYKVRKILKDVEEARSMGIQLHTLSLNELYNSLREARKQKAEFEKHHRGKFVYDPMEDQQFPFHTDGLHELAVQAIRETRRKRKSKSKTR